MPLDASSEPGGLAQLPIFLTLAGRVALVAGATPAAAAKIALLRRAGAKVRWTADNKVPESAIGGVERISDLPEAAALAGAMLCFVATGIAAEDATWAGLARAAGVPVNVVDRPELCDFIMPAIVDRSPVLVAISTGGTSPTLAKLVRRAVETALAPGIGLLAGLARTMRRRVRTVLPDATQRRRFWASVLDGPAGRLVADGRVAEGTAAFHAALALAAEEPTAPAGRVALVGAGPGRADLITVRGLRLLQEADVVLYDDLVSRTLVDGARAEARRIYVGKRGGRSSSAQEEINARLVAEAEAGRFVVRLKGGDPFVFGRGGEEMLALRARGIEVEIVPGVSSALAAAAAAEIPLTHRGVARQLHFVTGQGCEGALSDAEVAQLAAGGTIALYMARRGLDALARRLLESGLPAATPAVAIENATLPDERRVRGTAATIAAAVAAAGLAGPTLVMIGDVVALGRDMAASLRTQAPTAEAATA